MTEQVQNETSFFGDIVDGAQKMVGFKDGGFDNFGQRLGAVAVVAIPTIIVNDRFRVKPALKALPASQGAAVVENMFAGSLTIGKL